MGRATVLAVWLASAALAPIQAWAQEPLSEAGSSTIGYRSVAAALADLRGRPGVEESEQAGWPVFLDKGADGASVTLWSFAPAGHPAFPAVAKRQLSSVSGKTVLSMSIACEAEKAPCDALVRSFERLNAQMTESLNAQR